MKKRPFQNGWSRRELPLLSVAVIRQDLTRPTLTQVRWTRCHANAHEQKTRDPSNVHTTFIHLPPAQSVSLRVSVFGRHLFSCAAAQKWYFLVLLCVFGDCGSVVFASSAVISCTEWEGIIQQRSVAIKLMLLLCLFCFGKKNAKGNSKGNSNE